MMPSPSTEDAEIEELEAEIRKINRFLRWAPWLGLSVLAAVPVGYAFGAIAAWSVGVAAASCTGIVVYIPAMHRFEHTQRIQALRESRP